MQFSSWSEFFAMGGYGFFVWLAFGVTFVAMAGIWLESLFARRQLLRQIEQEMQRQKRIRSVRQQSAAVSEKEQ